VYVSDCQRELFSSTNANVMFARLQGPYYALVSRGTVARGPFISATCEEALPYRLNTSLITIDEQLHVSVSVPKPTADAPVYVALTAPQAGAAPPGGPKASRPARYRPSLPRNASAVTRRFRGNVP
jgi:hypothetical protein